MFIGTSAQGFCAIKNRLTASYWSLAGDDEYLGQCALVSEIAVAIEDVYNYYVYMDGWVLCEATMSALVKFPARQ